MVTHSAEYFRLRRRAAGVPERFPSNALIQRQAKELCAMEMMPLAEFIESPLSWVAPIKRKIDERDKT